MFKNITVEDTDTDSVQFDILEGSISLNFLITKYSETVLYFFAEMTTLYVVLVQRSDLHFIV